MKATLDIPKNVATSPDENVCFTATLLALIELLIERDFFTREELELKAQRFVEDPNTFKAADLAAAVAQRVFEKRLSAQLEKPKPDMTGCCPVVPTGRKF